MEVNKLVPLTGEVLVDRNRPVARGGSAIVYKGMWGTKLVSILPVVAGILFILSRLL
jgi:hypothetical protein